MLLRPPGFEFWLSHCLVVVTAGKWLSLSVLPFLHLRNDDNKSRISFLAGWLWRGREWIRAMCWQLGMPHGVGTPRAFPVEGTNCVVFIIHVCMNVIYWLLATYWRRQVVFLEWTKMIKTCLSLWEPSILSSLSLPGKQSTRIQQYPHGWHPVVLSFIRRNACLVFVPFLARNS